MTWIANYGPKCQVLEWSAKSCDFTIWILDTDTIRYLDESGIQVLGIQIITVSGKSGLIILNFFKVVSIGRLTAFYVVLFPLEFIPSEPPHFAFTVPVVNIGIYGLSHLRSGEAELIFVDPLNPL